MKKRITALILCLILSVLTLASCKIFTRGNGSDDANATPGVVFDSKTNVQFIVTDETLATDLIYYLHDEVAKVTPKYPEIGNDSLAKASREIIIGESSRDVTRRAFSHLSRLEKEDEKQVGYVVYTDGSSVAIVYEQDKYALNAAATKAIQKFTDEYIMGKEGFSHSAGVICSGFLDPLEYQEELDEETLNLQWTNLRTRLKANPNISDELADEIVLELQNYNAIFNDEVNSWLANLYDPGVGGFYYSNSGRDTEGFLPDIETTQQAIGMVESYGVEVPDWMKKQMGAWVKGLQDPNGYFYHPQWSKTETEQHPNRMGRDLERAIGIILDGGYQPTYDTILGHKGDGLNADGTPVNSVSPTALTEGLGGSSVCAVSKVVSASAGQGSIPTRLLNKDNFIAYIDSLDLNGNSYPVGNELATQASQIKARDKQLKAEGANYSLVDILINWLNEHQNPKTGMWTLRDEPDFEGVNGLLKILAVYSGVGAEFPHPIEAAKAAFSVIGNGEYLGSVCYLYNVWYAIDFIIENIEKYSTDRINLQNQMNEFRAEILKDAPRAIRETAAGVALFQKPDGSFSFTQTYSSPTSQGMRVALQNQYEGDVNASTICINGTANHMYSVLGLPRVRPFTKADALELLEMFEELQPVIKDEEIINNEPISFSDDTVGQMPLDVGTTVNSSGSITVVKTPELGKYLELRSENDGGDYITVPCNTSRLNSSCFVFEGDFCYTEDCQEGYISQIYMNLYIYMLGMKISDGYVHIWDSSSQGGSRVEQDLGVAIPLGEWFNLRIENYTGSADDVRIKVYINGDLIAVSDNYYDSTGQKVYPEGAAPQNYYNFVMVNIFSNAKGTILMDNLLSTKTSALYSPVEDDLKINVDALPEDEKIYDFEDGTTEDIIIDEASDSITVTDTENGKALALETVAEGGSSLTVPITRRVRKGNCGVFEADMLFNDAPVGTVFELAFREDTSAKAPLMRFRLIVTERDGEKFITLAESPDGKTGRLLDDAKMPIGESFTLRIEFYSDTQAALVYVDGDLYASSDYTCTGARYYTYGLFVIKNVSTAAASLTLDNVKAESITKSFDKATQPAHERVTYDFNSSLGEGVSADSGITASGGILSFKNAAAGATVRFPNNKRSVVASAAIFEAKINHLSNAPLGKLYEIALTDASDNKIVSLIVSNTDSGFAIYENTENKTYSSPIATFVSGYETVTVEYYADKGMINVYVGGSAAAATCLVYSAENADLSYEYATITKLSAKESFSVDYAFAESYNKFYEKIAQTKLEAFGTLDFDSAFTSKIPSGLTTSFKSSGAALRIEEAMVKYTASKVLAFDTSAGANDNLTFNLTANAAKGNALVFDTDVAFDFTSGDKHIQLYLESSGGKSYMMDFYESAGYVYFYDISSASKGVYGKSVKIAECGEWFNLRIEYYSGTNFDTVRAKTYINGNLVYVSNNFYGSQAEGAVPYNDSNAVRFYTYGGCVATTYFDNVTLEKKTLACADDPLTKDSEPAPTPEEPPVIVDPDAGKVPGKYYIGLGDKIYSYDTVTAVWNGLYNNGKGLYHINYSASGTGLGSGFEENGERAFINIESMEGKSGYETNVLSYGKNSVCTAKGHLAFPETYSVANGNVFVFETDFYAQNAGIDPESTDDTVLLLRFATGEFKDLVGTNKNTALYDVVFRLKDGKICVEDSETAIELTKWYTLTVECYFTEGYAIVYLDGAEITAFDIGTDASFNMTGVQLQLFESTKPAKYFLDNTFVGTVYKEGVADADEPETDKGNREGGKYFTANGGYTYNITSVWSDLDTKEIIDRNTDSTTADSTAGSFLRVENVLYDPTLCFGKASASYMSEFYFKKSGDGDGVVFESSMLLTSPQGSGLVGKAIFTMGLTSGMRNGNAAAMPTFNNTLSFVLNEDGSYTVGDKMVCAGEWFNLSIELFDGKVNVYIDGVLASSADAEIDAASVTHMGFTAIKESSDVKMHLDNTFFGAASAIE